jgi:hypothetical protein
MPWHLSHPTLQSLIAEYLTVWNQVRPSDEQEACERLMVPVNCLPYQKWTSVKSTHKFDWMVAMASPLK